METEGPEPEGGVQRARTRGPLHPRASSAPSLSPGYSRCTMLEPPPLNKAPLTPTSSLRVPRLPLRAASVCLSPSSAGGHGYQDIPTRPVRTGGCGAVQHPRSEQRLEECGAMACGLTGVGGARPGSSPVCPAGGGACSWPQGAGGTSWVQLCHMGVAAAQVGRAPAGPLGRWRPSRALTTAGRGGGRTPSRGRRPKATQRADSSPPLL